MYFAIQLHINDVAKKETRYRLRETVGILVSENDF